MTKRRYWTGAKKVPAQDKFFIGALDPDLWTAGDETNWDACWHTGMPARSIYKNMRPGQWVNHMPGNHALTVKSKLFETLDTARRRAPAELQEKYQFFPRSYLMPEGYHALQKDAFADPEKRWIFKPKSLSRGRGISVSADAGTAPIDEKMLVQEYLKRPHLYDGRKYVLRCYLAIMSAEPLRVYLYKEGFVKLASEPYSDGDFGNLYAHLTNPDVNALNEAVDDSVVFHSFADYRRWLEQNGADPAPLFDALRDIAVITAIAARDTLRERTTASGAWAPGCCELIGMDCMIDADLKPWLLECNLSPSLGVCAAPETGGIMEEEIKRAVVADFVAMSGLNNGDALSAEPDNLASLIAASEQEREHAGGFECVYPGAAPDEFFPFFPAPRHADIALADTVSPTASNGYILAANDTSEYAFDDKIALHKDGMAQPMSPSTAGAYIWLRATGGDAPETIANDLAAFAGDEPVSKDAALKTVWDTLADWGAAGLLRPANMSPLSDAPIFARPANEEIELFFKFSDHAYRLRLSSPEIAPRIEGVIGPLRIDSPDQAKPTEIVVLTETAGYAIALNSQLLRTRLRLAEIAPALADILVSEYARTRLAAPVLNASLWRMDGKTVLIASTKTTRWDGIGAALSAEGKAELLAGGVLLGETPGLAHAAPAPARVKMEDAPQPSQFISQWANESDGVLLALPSHPEELQSVDVVVIPKLQKNASAQEIAQLNGRDAFNALTNLCAGPAVSATTAARLAQWAEEIPCFAVPFADCAGGARAVEAAVSALK